MSAETQNSLVLDLSSSYNWAFDFGCVGGKQAVISWQMILDSNNVVEVLSELANNSRLGNS
jgi:hypothetical protein